MTPSISEGPEATIYPYGENIKDQEDGAVDENICQTRAVEQNVRSYFPYSCSLVIFVKDLLTVKMNIISLKLFVALSKIRIFSFFCLFVFFLSFTFLYDFINSNKF